MHKEQVLGILRHFLTFGGGILVASGKADPGTVTEVVGGAITVIGSLWSYLAKR